MAPRIFSIAMGADYSPYVKSMANFALTFFDYINSFLASVSPYQYPGVEIARKT